MGWISTLFFPSGASFRNWLPPIIFGQTHRLRNRASPTTPSDFRPKIAIWTVRSFLGNPNKHEHVFVFWELIWAVWKQYVPPNSNGLSSSNPAASVYLPLFQTTPSLMCHIFAFKPKLSPLSLHSITMHESMDWFSRENRKPLFTAKHRENQSIGWTIQVEAMAAEIPDPEEWTPPEEERGRVGECHGCFFLGRKSGPKTENRCVRLDF